VPGGIDAHVQSTFEKAVKVFLAAKKPKMRRTPGYQLEGDLNRSFMGRRRRRVWDKERKEWASEWVQGRQDYFRRRPVPAMTYSDVRQRLREIELHDGKYAARHALLAIRSFFKWSLKEEEFGFRYDTPPLSSAFLMTSSLDQVYNHGGDQQENADEQPDHGQLVDKTVRLRFMKTLVVHRYVHSWRQFPEFFR
jgi:hypothetical protein